MTSTTPDDLKAIYREKATLFLTKEGAGGSLVSIDVPCGGATEMAKSLVIRSLYETKVPTNFENQFHCILSSQEAASVPVQNLIRSGAHNVPVPIEEVEKLTMDCTNDTCTRTQRFTKLQSSLYDFYCKCCGTGLLPIPGNTKDGEGRGRAFKSQIKLIKAKRGKTRRRRASRYTAKKHVYDTKILQKHKGGGRTFAQTQMKAGHSNGHGEVVASYSRTQAALKSIAATRRIGDGMCKNYIRYECQCGHAMSVKGIKASSRKSSGGRLDIRQQETQAKVRPRQTPLGKHNDEFIQLSAPFPSSKGVHQPQPARASKRQKSQNKRQKSSSKSKLQDFLSSLND
jgi:hypothetical protein